MVKEELDRRVKRCCVNVATLEEGVNCGAFPDMESALDYLDDEMPLGNEPTHVVAVGRIKAVNDQIDRALFDMAKATSAWTRLGDMGIVFVLIGPESRGYIIHENMKRKISFELTLHSRKSVTRFLRFKGDMPEEREVRDGKPILSLFQLLCSKLRMSTYSLRDMFENLVRVCDDPGWVHTKFPFVYYGPSLDKSLRLLARHRLVLHNPYSAYINPQ